MRQSVNNGQEFKTLLPKFVVAHAQGKEQAQWQRPGHGYSPQTWFYAPGEEAPLPIQGSSDKSPHFFHDEATLVFKEKIKAAQLRAGMNLGDAPDDPQSARPGT